MALYNDHARSCKRHHMDIMDDYLASIGCKRKAIPKDGSCLFRAFSEQIFFTQAHHLYIREACVRYMKLNQDMFENFIDDPFDEYLQKMVNPKESADQIEISALSKMYRCDFHIYEQPGQSAKNVTENDFCKSVYLCHSGQKHYDSVYSVEYFESFGVCQSILFSLLFRNVFGMSSAEEKKSVTTFRMLGPPKEPREGDTAAAPFTVSSIYEPSIGILAMDIPPEDQMGLAYKLPISLDFVRGLDPCVFRNIDYDFWITIKRKQQYIDFAVAEGMQYLIGDRCLVILSIYSKPLVSHVQEVSPSNGPITVFIEALGGMHTIAVKNAKSLDSFGNGCRSEVWPGRWRRRPPLGDNNWSQSRSNNNPQKFKSRDDDSGYSKSYDYHSAQRKRSQNSFSDSNGERGQYSSKTDLARRPMDDFSHQKHHRYKGKSRWAGGSGYKTHCSDSPPVDCYLPSSNIEADSQIDEMWPECSDYNNMYKTSWSGPDQPSSVSPVQTPDNLFDNQAEENYNEEKWLDSGEYNMIGDSNGSTESNNTVYLNPNAQSTPQQNATDEMSSKSAVLMSTDYQIAQNMTEELSNVNLGEYQDEQCLVDEAQQTAQFEMQNCHAAGSSNPVAAHQPPGYFPYSGSITMFDTEGKELMVSADNKNPFQYFYNLGLEYYRHLSGTSPRAGGSSGAMGIPHQQHYQAMVPQGPVMQNPTMGYMPTNQTGVQYPPPPHPVQHHQQGGACVGPIHIHPVLLPPCGQYQSGRFLVHVPPPQSATYPLSQVPSNLQAPDDVRPLSGPEHREHQSAEPPISLSQQQVQQPQVQDQVNTHHSPIPITHPNPISSGLVLPTYPMNTPLYPNYVGQYHPSYPQPPVPYNPGVTVYDPGASAVGYPVPGQNQPMVNTPRSNFS